MRLSWSCMLLVLTFPAPVSAQSAFDLFTGLSKSTGGVVWGSIGVRDLFDDGHGYETQGLTRFGLAFSYKPSSTVARIHKIQVEGDSASVPSPDSTRYKVKLHEITFTRTYSGPASPMSISAGYMWSTDYPFASPEFRAVLAVEGPYVGVFFSPRTKEESVFNYLVLGFAAEFLEIKESASSIQAVPVRISANRTVASEFYVGATIARKDAPIAGFVELSYQYMRFPSVKYEKANAADVIDDQLLRRLPRALATGSWHLTIGASMPLSGLFW